MRFLNLIKKELFYGGLTREEFWQVRELVNEANRKNIISHSIVVLLFWAVAFIVYGSDHYSDLIRIFPYAFFICTFSLVCGLFLIKKFPVLLHPVKYFMEVAFLEVGVSCLIVFQSDVGKAVYAFVLAVLVPILFIDRTITSFILETIMVISFVVLGYGTTEPDFFIWGLRTLIIFSVTGVIAARFINNGRFERYIYADSAKKLADIQKSYNSELKKEVAAKTERIVNLQDKLIIGMSTMVESRDNSTGGHIKRTSSAVRILTEAIKEDGSLHLSDEFCENIIKAAPMHDLGKIAVDDVILRKPGRFTPDEYEIMKTHAPEGARIVHEILNDSDDREFLRIAENIAHYHHERVDGSGYPDKLKGDEIPLEARIMAIADVYDALVSKRVYKESYSFEKADQIILEGMGTQFDPNLRKYYEAARSRLEEYYGKCS